jgi:uncharacterized membrane protein YfcA
MTIEITLLAFGLFFIVALLYSSVGHAGATGYLAIMALLSFPVDSIKGTSLVLNILVSAIGTYRFLKAGFFDKKVFLTFAVTSIPIAFVGGAMQLDPKLFKLLAGIFLMLSAVLLIGKNYLVKPSTDEPKDIPLVPGLGIGAAIGFLSGLIGVGGGVFLSPIMILMNWTTVKKASGVAALFILCNSVTGLIGHLSKLQKVDVNIGYWAVAVIIGGLIGSYLGTSKFSNKVILAILALVLLTAGFKFVFVG